MKMNNICNFLLLCAIYNFVILLSQCDEMPTAEEDGLLAECIEINEIIHNAREYFENKLNAISCDDSPELLSSYQTIYDDLSTIIHTYIKLTQGIVIYHKEPFEEAKKNIKNLKQNTEDNICEFSFSKYTINFKDDNNKNVHLLQFIKLTSLFEFITGNSIKKFGDSKPNSEKRTTDFKFYEQYFLNIDSLFAKNQLSISILKHANEKIVEAIEKNEIIDDLENINKGVQALPEIYKMFHNIAVQYSKCDDSIATVNTMIRKIYEKSSFETLSDFYKNVIKKNKITDLKQTIENIKNDLDVMCSLQNDNKFPTPGVAPAAAPTSGAPAPVAPDALSVSGPDVDPDASAPVLSPTPDSAPASAPLPAPVLSPVPAPVPAPGSAPATTSVSGPDASAPLPAPASAPLPAPGYAPAPATNNNNHKEEKEFQKYLRQIFERLKANAEKYNGVIEILGPLACSTADKICGKNFPLLEIIKKEFEEIEKFDDPKVTEKMNSAYKKVNDEYFLGQKKENFVILFEMVTLVVSKKEIITKCFKENKNIFYYISEINAVSKLTADSLKDDSKVATNNKNINTKFNKFVTSISTSNCNEKHLTPEEQEFTEKMNLFMESNLKSLLWICWGILRDSDYASNEIFTTNFHELSNIIDNMNNYKVEVERNIERVTTELKKFIKLKKIKDYNKIHESGTMGNGLVKMAVKYFLNELDIAACIISYGKTKDLRDENYYLDDFNHVVSLLNYVTNIASGIFVDFVTELKKIQERFSKHSVPLHKYCNFLNNKYLLNLNQDEIDGFHWLRYYKFANLIQIIITNAFKKFEDNLTEEEMIKAIDFTAKYLKKFKELVEDNSLKTSGFKSLWKKFTKKFMKNVESTKLKKLNDKLVSEIQGERHSFINDKFMENCNIILKIYENFQKIANEYKECSNANDTSNKIREIFGSKKFVNALKDIFETCFYEINYETYPIRLQQINHDLREEKNRILSEEFSCQDKGTFDSTKLFAEIYNILYKRAETDITILMELGPTICNKQHEICFPDFHHFSLVQRNWEDEFTDITNIESKQSQKIKLFNNLANDLYCFGMWMQVYDIYEEIGETIKLNVDVIKKCGIKEKNSILHFIKIIAKVIQLIETKMTNQVDINNEHLNTDKFDEAKKLRNLFEGILQDINKMIIEIKSKINCQSSQNQNDENKFGSESEEELIEKFAIILKHIFVLMTRDTKKLISHGRDITGDPYSKGLSNNLKEIVETLKEIDLFDKVKENGEISKDELLAIDALAENAKRTSDAVSIFDNFSLLHSTIIIFVNYLIYY